MSNADLLKKYFDENDLKPDTWKDGDNTLFQFTQKLKVGPSGRLLIAIDEDALVNIYALDYISLANAEKKDSIYKLLNELNSQYTYFKFYLTNDNNIVLQSSMPVRNNFNAEIVVQIMIGAIKAMEEEYPGIMKAMWA